MATNFLRQQFNFPSRSGGPQVLDRAFVFQSPVRNAEAAINGFSIGFTSSDHHLLRQEIHAVVTSVSGNTVTVRVRFALRDSSGHFDDKYDGYVDVLVIAEV